MFYKGSMILVVVILVGRIESLPSQINIGILLPQEQKDGHIDQGYRWGLKYLNKANATLLPQNVKVVPKSIYVKAGDSFRASKELCKLLGTGIVALLGGGSHVDPSLEWKLFWTSARMDVPLFFVTPSFARKKVITGGGEGQGQSQGQGHGKRPDSEFALRLAPTLHVWGQLLRELTKYLGLQNVAILYEDERGLMRTQALLREPSPVEHIIVRKVGGDSYKSVLAEAKSREIRHIIVDCQISSLPSLLSAIEGLHMTDYKYHYILTNLDLRTTDMTNFVKSNVNLTSFQLINPEAKNVQDKLAELRSLDHEINATLESSYQGNIHTETALAFDSVMALGTGLTSLETSHVLKPENLSCDSDVPWGDGLSLLNYITAAEFKGLSGHVSFKEGDRANLKLDIIRLGANGWRKVGHWTPERGLNVTKPKAFWDHGLTNATLLVTCVLEAPYVQLRQGTNLTGNSRFEGFSVDLLKLISNVVGFNYVLEVVPDGKYGVYDSETGEWNGVIRQLTDKSVDLGIGALTITHSRESVVDFTKPFMHFGISILFRKPIRTRTGVFTFLKPLALEIWLSVALSYLLVSFTMFIVARFSPYEWSATTTAMAYGVGERRVGVVRNQFTISNALWYPIGTLMQQGSDLNPKSASTRIVGGIWWFFSIVIVSSYTANLAAFLTVQRLANPIESARDLVEQSEVAYGSLESGTTMAYFRDSKIETYQKMWRFMDSRKPSVFTSTYAEGVRRVLAGNNYAFLMESTTIAYVQAQNCNLTQIGGLLNSKGYGIALPKGSPWKDKISLAILELQERSVIRWYQDKWWTSQTSVQNDLYCNREYKKDTTASALGVDSIGGIFVVLVIGLAIAVLVALLEFCWSSKKQANSDQVTLCTEMTEEAKFSLSCSGQNCRQKPELIRHCDMCQLSRDRSRSATPLPFPILTPSTPPTPLIPPPPPPPHLCRNHFHLDFQEYDDDFSFSPAYEEQEQFGVRNRSGHSLDRR